MPRRFVRPLLAFTQVEASAGVVLLGTALAALVWANLFGDSYTAFWDTRAVVSVGLFRIDHSLTQWVNEGLMAFFFLRRPHDVHTATCSYTTLDAKYRPHDRSGCGRLRLWLVGLSASIRGPRDLRTPEGSEECDCFAGACRDPGAPIGPAHRGCRVRAQGAMPLAGEVVPFRGGALCAPA